MSSYPALRNTDDEAQQLCADVFPQGWAADDVIEELAPDGWEASSLSEFFIRARAAV